MQKRIPVTQLRLGMYVERFEGSWLDHPFWRSRFVLEDPKDLVRILGSGMTEVWIDSSKGLDVAVDDTLAPATEPDLPTPAPSGRAESAAPVQPVTFQEELSRAAKICLSARDEMTRMFSEARMGRAIDTTVVRGLVEDISDSVTRQGSALISLARLKNADNYTYMHSVAVCALMIALARQLGLDAAQTRAAGFAGLVHDIGKMAVPMHVLNKPGRLSDAEFELVRRHPQQGWELLREAGVEDADALDVCLHHPERVDGSGYPERLGGAQLSLVARMGAVCDVYDAITSNRPYKTGWDPAESLSHMAKWTCTHLDEPVFQAFVRSLGIYPVGSLVRLSNEKLAVVTEQSAGSLLKPIVRVFFSLRHQERIPPSSVDLSAHGVTVRVMGREDPARWQFADLNEIWSGGVAV